MIFLLIYSDEVFIFSKKMDDENMLKLDPRIFSSVNYSPLLNYIDLCDKEEIVEYFRVNGIESAVTEDCFGWSPIAYACYAGRNDSLQFLLDLGVKITDWALLNSISGSDRDAETLKILLKAGGNVNSVVESEKSYHYRGDTLLHRCVKQGSLACFKTLLEYGADIHAKNHKGQSPRDLVTSYLYRGDMLALLEEYEAYEAYKVKEPGM